MGATHVTVTIRNPAEPERSWDSLFLVDTGTIDSLVPRDHLESIGLKPKSKRIYELADGTEQKMDITTGDLEFMGVSSAAQSLLASREPNRFWVLLHLSRLVLRSIRKTKR